MLFRQFLSVIALAAIVVSAAQNANAKSIHANAAPPNQICAVTNIDANATCLLNDNGAAANKNVQFINEANAPNPAVLNAVNEEVSLAVEDNSAAANLASAQINANAVNSSDAHGAVGFVAFSPQALA